MLAIKLKSFLGKHEFGPVVLFTDLGQDKEGSCWYQLLLQHLLTFIFSWASLLRLCILLLPLFWDFLLYMLESNICGFGFHSLFPLTSMPMLLDDQDLKCLSLVTCNKCGFIPLLFL